MLFDSFQAKNIDSIDIVGKTKKRNKQQINIFLDIEKYRFTTSTYYNIISYPVKLQLRFILIR